MSASLAAQAVAVERALLSVRGHRDVIAKLVARGKRPAHELVTLEHWLADLAPAVATMQWLARNEGAIGTAPTLPLPTRTPACRSSASIERRSGEPDLRGERAGVRGSRS